MPWTSGVTELRTLLSDGPTDRYNFRKQCFGEINGTNTRFKTFDFRRVTDFTVTQGVYVDGVLQTLPAVAQDSPETGEFILTSAPADGSLVEASYYIQWFLDAELQTFLTDSARWLLGADDFTLITGGLIPAALKYAASEAYLKQAQRWKVYLSSGYKVEDAPKEGASGQVQDFMQLAETYREQALKLRDEYYGRQGRSQQSSFAAVLGRVRSLP
jgi:hypothetical protein